MYRNPSGNASRISAKTVILSTSPLFPVRMTSRVRAIGLDYTMEHPAETPGGNSPLDCCIYMGSSLPLFPVRATGLEYTMEHPASSRRMATVHRTVAFTWVRACRLYQNKKGARRLLFYSMWKWRNGHNPINARKARPIKMTRFPS